MPGMTDLLSQMLQGDTLRQISTQIGADEQTTASAIDAALPTLVGALARNASSEQGAASLATALARDHDGSILDNLGAVLGGGGGVPGGAAILGHVFGGRQGAVQDALGQSTGLGSNATGQLMAMLAPIVLGALTRSAQQGGGLSPGSLSDLLGGEQASLQQRSPDMMGMLGSLLDSNNDGSVVDDLGRLASRFFTSGR